jgi:hypothetical protein
MTKISQKFLTLLIIVLILGCVSTRSIRYETIVRPPKPSDYPIEILDLSNINRPYKVIGIVQANAGKLHSTDDTIEHLKAEARKMGGDALIDLQQGTSKGGVIVPAGDMYVYGNVREIWSAKVIVWEQP